MIKIPFLSHGKSIAVTIVLWIATVLISRHGDGDPVSDGRATPEDAPEDYLHWSDVKPKDVLRRRGIMPLMKAAGCSVCRKLKYLTGFRLPMLQILRSFPRLEL
jgi:hypothetical protein